MAYYPRYIMPDDVRSRHDWKKKDVILEKQVYVYLFNLKWFRHVLLQRKPREGVSYTLSLYQGRVGDLHGFRELDLNNLTQNNRSN